VRVRYCFEVKQEIVTPVDVYAESEQEARERISLREDSVTFYDPISGDMCLSLLRLVDE
jgi:hypothetical protein